MKLTLDLFFKSKISINARKFSNTNHDYYKTLGISNNATQQEIKQAFVKMTQLHHPDKSKAPDAQTKFSNIAEAYSALSDSEKRKVYDQQYYNSTKNSNEHFTDSDYDFSDFFKNQQRPNEYANVFKDFEEVFGFQNKQKNKNSNKGQDISISIELDLLESFTGVQKEINYRVKDTCSSCKGSCCQTGTHPTKCLTCKGKGTVSYRQGPMIIQMGCNCCKGKGKVIKNPCSGCKGTGLAYISKKEFIDITKGVVNGHVIKLPQKGNKSDENGYAGDLLIKIIVKQDNYFKREGNDVHTTSTISVAQAVLGDKIEIRTLRGIKSLIIPPGTSHGSKFRIESEGFWKQTSSQEKRGDQIVNIVIHLPLRLNARQKEAYKILQEVDKETGIF